jgi:hypothetical protein
LFTYALAMEVKLENLHIPDVIKPTWQTLKGSIKQNFTTINQRIVKTNSLFVYILI